jgi:hypothetical protein
MNKNLYKQFAAEDDISIDKVVKYIHQYIKFSSSVDKVSYQASMDDTFDWIVEKVNEQHEKELSDNNSMQDDITLTERFRNFTQKVSRIELGYGDVSIDELRLELNSLDEKLEKLSWRTKQHDVNNYL